LEEYFFDNGDFGWAWFDFGNKDKDRYRTQFLALECFGGFGPEMLMLMKMP
jgi:hypothetical protein